MHNHKRMPRRLRGLRNNKPDVSAFFASQPASRTASETAVIAEIFFVTPRPPETRHNSNSTPANSANRFSTQKLPPIFMC